jgi:hypothetical protein
MCVTSQAHAGAWVYQNCGYGGYAKYLGNGTYTLAQLNAAGISNDDLSSISVDAGSRMQVFENDNFGGSWDWFYGTRDCLVGNRKVNGGNWNDQISSLKIEGYSGGGMIVDYVEHQWWNGSGWVTDFRDDFSGTSLDTNNWQVHDSYWHGVFNGEAQCYVNEQGVNNNFWLGAGELNILVQKENRDCGGYTHAYSSARLITKRRKEFNQGRWNVRSMLFKSDNANGIWPANWLLETNINEQPDPGGACWPTPGARELDFFEYTTNYWAANLPSWDSYITAGHRGPGCQNDAWPGRTDKTGNNPYVMHTYSVEFWGGLVKFWRDSDFVGSMSAGDYAGNYFLLLNVALGGNLGSNPYGW